MRCVRTLRAPQKSLCRRSASAVETLQQMMSTFNSPCQELRYLLCRCPGKVPEVLRILKMTL